MSGQKTRLTLEVMEDSQPVGSLVSSGQPPNPQRNNPGHPDPQFQHGGRHVEATPPHPSVADVLALMEQNQQDQTYHHMSGMGQIWLNNLWRLSVIYAMLYVWASVRH